MLNFGGVHPVAYFNNDFFCWHFGWLNSSCELVPSSKVQLIKSLPTQDLQLAPMFSLPFSLPWLGGWAPCCCEICQQQCIFLLVEVDICNRKKIEKAVELLSVDFPDCCFAP